MSEDVNYPSTVWGQIVYRKTILLKEEGLLRYIIVEPNVLMSSIHKQAIARLGEKLSVTAFELNGVVQTIENPDRQF